MSIKTWKEEYLKPLKEGDGKLSAILKSTLKWEGLKKKNLKKHGVRLEGEWLIDTQNDHFLLGEDNCHLCFYADEIRNRKGSILSGCRFCPMYEATGTTCANSDAWMKFKSGNSRPIRALLKQTLIHVISTSC